MSARYVPVSWTPAKRAYDVVLVTGVAGYLLAFLHLAPRLSAATEALDTQSLVIMALGSCAFLLLSLALAIGPLARLDRRLLPLLYNRRHLGVVTFLVALSHALAVLGWHFAFSPTPAVVALLSSEPAPGFATGLPFVLLGVLALLILFALAATSHDVWLAFLTPPAWKALHMLIYPAYALAVGHIAFGALQDAGSPALAALVVGVAAALVVLHVAAALLGDKAAAGKGEAAWIPAGRADAVPEGRAVIIRPPGAEAVAIFRHQGKLSAVSNLCAHQNGPLGEGRIVDGCITCPWHGYQYRPEDGCAPPPFTEKLATYRLKLEGEQVLLDPRPNPPGTRVEPLAVPTQGAAPDAAPFFIGWAARPPMELRRVLLGSALAILVGLPGLGLVMGLGARDHAGDAFATVPGQALPPDLPEPAALRGLVLDGPYPLLFLPPEAAGGRGRTLLLADDGKRGAPDATRALTGRFVAAEGFVLRRGTIEMLVLSGTPTPIADAPAPAAPPREPLGRWRIQGEICDGKCASGGMRPGTGIAHRACATLCLDGALPAVFVATHPVAGHAFLLLGDATGGPGIPAFRDLLGQRVTLEGAVERRGDMLVFRAEPP